MKATIDQLIKLITQRYADTGQRVGSDFIEEYAERWGLKVEVLTPPGPHYDSIEEAIASGDPRFGVVPLLVDEVNALPPPSWMAHSFGENLVAAATDAINQKHPDTAVAVFMAIERCSDETLEHNILYAANAVRLFVMCARRTINEVTADNWKAIARLDAPLKQLGWRPAQRHVRIRDERILHRN